MQVVWDYRMLLLQGVWITIQVTVTATMLAIVLSLLAGLARQSNVWLLRTPATVYVELFRGTSLLAQLFWMFFVLPAFGVSMTPLLCGVLAIGLCNGAYGSEIVRGALRSVAREQREAAIALNFNRFQAFRIVVLPQAARIMTPLFGNLAIEVMKASSLVSLITLPDLTFQARNINLVHVVTAPVLIVVLLIYFAIALVISGGTRGVEHALAKGRDRLAA
ncbi:ectoine/hydroxyectoine ABC transporter permease subunit EhuC [Methylocapsa sp. S129]|uniref:ectoine/hydroxyectoine ABC transporter permease subunit EhuC n=1 Tax=Methylocapsa sp. S129 TaxID=1641869 RepID=UPI00131BF728|nr:ectoine/hydroxyectoine ABC transporter permease subunit EhuC [Methylocapsa sp. S129]